MEPLTLLLDMSKGPLGDIVDIKVQKDSAFLDEHPTKFNHILVGDW